MSPGYIYILSNRSMPGLLKIGRTERLPKIRSKELQTTGVPHPFEVDFSVFVNDSIKAEQQIHKLLEKQGVRAQANREFFELSLEKAIHIIGIATVSDQTLEPDFSQIIELEALANTIPSPNYGEEISYEDAEKISFSLVNIGRRGCPSAIKRAAQIFERNRPSGIRFKEFYREYLSIARAYLAYRSPIYSSNSELDRVKLGQEIAEYAESLHRHRWLTRDDLQFISDYLVAGDRFQYEGYIKEIQRLNLPQEIREKLENL